VLDNPTSSFLTWLVIGIALALPVGMSVALDNLSQLGRGWDSPAQISLFLRDGLELGEARAFEQGLAARDDVAATVFVDREQALREFSDLSGFADLLASLDDNPLPNLVLVTPAATDSQGAQALQAELASTPEVALAVLDMAWLQRLNELLALSRRLVLAVGGLLVLGVVLILGNTIRLAIESRREEIVIVKLVGGSNAFVRRPFLYTGLWYGVGGGVFAAALVAASLWFLGEPVNRLAELYDSDFRLAGLGVMGALNLILVSGLLGLAGAWLAVARHLSEIEPR
jgi:cell division transport system permease protein